MAFTVTIEQNLAYTEKLVAEFDDPNKALDFMYVILMSCKNAKVTISANEVKPE